LVVVSGRDTGQSGEDEATDPRVGRVLQGRYKVLAPIAAGAMGSVYRAERVGLGRSVAVKFLHAQLASDPALVKRFSVEARAMSRLAHPNCVSVIDFGVDDLPYLVMDLLQWTSLRRLLDHGPVPAPRAVRIIRQMLAALTHAHAQGIVHRDIKPENVVLEQAAGLEEHVRILDFGLAHFLGGENKSGSMALGTPNYMAPELTTGEAHDARVDTYGTAVVLFELLVGRAPFDAPDMGAIFLNVRTRPPPRLREVAPHAGFSAALEALLVKAMAKRAAERFQSAAEMSAALDAVPEAPWPLNPPSTLQPMAAAQPPVRTRRRVIAISGVALAGVVALAATLGRGRDAVPAPPAPIVVAAPPATAPAPPPAPAPIVAASPKLREPPPPRRSARPAPRPSPRPALSRREPEVKRAPPESPAKPTNASQLAKIARAQFEKGLWAEGMVALRAAVELDPVYRSDAVLLKHVISALQSQSAGDDAAEYLRQQAAQARPYLREAEASHPVHRVRLRAAQILRSSEPSRLGSWFKSG
jgi:tRNA A-37 threonylcarbamoyl transferase component Bud32